jgi:predicted MFS family arabinose efflux permease
MIHQKVKKIEMENRYSDNPPHASIRVWGAVTSIALGTFALVTSEFLPVGLLTKISSDLQVSEGAAGLMVTMPGVVAAFAAPLLTVATGRLDRKVVLCILTAVIVASNLLAALAPDLVTMLGARILLGIGVGGFWSFAAGLGVRLVPEQSAGRATSIILAGISIGTVFGVPAGAIIGDLAGWRSAFVATGLFSVAVLIAQAFLLPSLPVTQRVELRTLPGLFKIPAAPAGLFITVLLITGHFAGYTYLRPLLEQVPSMSSELIATMLLVYGVSGFVGNFVGEAAIRRSLKGALVWSATAIGIVLVAAPHLASGPLSSFIIVAVWGTAFGAVPLCLQTWMMRSTVGSTEGGLALFISVFQLALASGATIGGVVVDGSGIAAAVTFGGCLSLATAIFVFLSKYGTRTFSATAAE